jgi:hypothetical protein
MSIMMVKFNFTIMTPDPSLPTDSRRDFVKKSIAATIIVAQPTILAGLIRAEGGGGGSTGSTNTTAFAVISEVRSFTVTFEVSDPFTGANAELRCRDAASTRLWQLVGQSTYVGPTTYGSTEGLVNKLKFVTGGIDYNPVTVSQASNGDWTYTISIAAGSYTVFYWIAEE